MAADARKRRGVLSWLIARRFCRWRVIALIIPFAYVASTGPAVGLWSWLGRPDWLMSVLVLIYWPVNEFVQISPDWLTYLLSRYWKLWAPDP